MRKLVILVTLALVASLILVPVARAQEGEEKVEEQVETPGGGEVEIEAKGPPEAVEPAVQQVEQKAAATSGIEGTVMIEATGPPPPAPLPTSGGPGIGGPAVILPAAAVLLLGSGVLAYAVLRRRS